MVLVQRAKSAFIATFPIHLTKVLHLQVSTVRGHSVQIFPHDNNRMVMVIKATLVIRLSRQHQKAVTHFLRVDADMIHHQLKIVVLRTLFILIKTLVQETIFESKPTHNIKVQVTLSIVINLLVQETFFKSQQMTQITFMV